MTPEPFTLSEQDKAQGLWLRFKDHLLERLASARIRNDGALDGFETASLRGEIRTLKRILALGDDRPVIPTEYDQPPD